jgi:aspartate/methionine/tyrosine aminotransferase
LPRCDSLNVLIKGTKSSADMNSDTFADRMLRDQQVAPAPGAIFGNAAGHYVRVNMAVDDKAVIEDLQRVCGVIKSTS